MNFSKPFIEKPILTSLLMVAIVLLGALGYHLLPVAALPEVDSPTIQVTAQLPGADPQTVASSVATPLERQFGQIPGLAQMTSSSALGYTQITLQFSRDRTIDSAAQDVQSAIGIRRTPLADRHLCGDVCARFQPRQSIADGADDRRRLRGRRCDRDDREHSPPHRRRKNSDAGRARWCGRDRLYYPFDIDIAHRRFHSALSHERHCRSPVLTP
jgi:hypothetical protein